MNYEDFLSNKVVDSPLSGWTVTPDQIHPTCFPHQRDTIIWAAAGGQRAIFAQFGLGKSTMQLELSRLCVAQFGGKALIVCPLGVKQEFRQDAGRLGIEVEYCRTQAECEASACQIILTNYERVRDGDIRPDFFTCACLDEASVLRSYGSKTYQEFLEKFGSVRFKWVCTATPSPNRFKELIHYAGFLGIMDTGQALTRFFKRDSTKANNLTIHPHKEREFWLWVASWGLFLTRPSDLGYDDAGYDLPDLEVYWHMVSVPKDEQPVDRDGQIKLVRDEAYDLKTAAKEKSTSIAERVAKAVELIQTGDDDQAWVVWHHLEDERKALDKAADWAGWKTPDGYLSVYGSQTEDQKENGLVWFAQGKYRILATKPSIAGQGCNFQKHCHSAIFLGIDYGFNDFVQALHRIQRFQQPHTCQVHIIYTDAEEHIRKELEAKWNRHKELVAEMTGIIKDHGLAQSAMLGEMKRAMGVDRQVKEGRMYTAVNNDNVPETRRMASNSVGLIHTSIPFSNHYEYTPSYNDFGHTQNDDHFFEQMDFLTPELHRVLMPGRMCVVHVKDRILFGNVTGYGMPTVNPFHMKTTFHYLRHGFVFAGMITIETDVVRENNQTYRLGWTEQCKDGSKMGIGSPEYLLLFRKLPSDTSNAYADVPVTKSKEEYTRGRWQIDARAKWNSSGNTLLTPQEIGAWPVDKLARHFTERHRETVYDFAAHVEAANQMDEYGKLPATFESLRVPARTDYVWDDVVRMRTLNSRQSQRREDQHICPLQLDIVERVIERWSNPGDLVYDPFAGLHTVPYVAIQKGRRGYGCELNTDYWRAGVGYCKEAEYKQSVPTLFDFLQTA